MKRAFTLFALISFCINVLWPSQSEAFPRVVIKKTNDPITLELLERRLTFRKLFRCFIKQEIQSQQFHCLSQYFSNKVSAYEKKRYFFSLASMNLNISDLQPCSKDFLKAAVATFKKDANRFVCFNVVDNEIEHLVMFGEGNEKTKISSIHMRGIPAF